MLDATKGIPADDELDVVTCVDVLHDTADPLRVLEQLRRALRKDGHLLIGEYESEDDPAENTGAIATTMYGFSITYCVPSTLAAGGDALGTLGLPKGELAKLCAKAGFEEPSKIPTGHPLIALYQTTPR